MLPSRPPCLPPRRIFHAWLPFSIAAKPCIEYLPKKKTARFGLIDRRIEAANRQTDQKTLVFHNDHFASRHYGGLGTHTFR